MILIHITAGFNRHWKLIFFQVEETALREARQEKDRLRALFDARYDFVNLTIFYYEFILSFFYWINFSHAALFVKEDLKVLISCNDENLIVFMITNILGVWSYYLPKNRLRPFRYRVMFVLFVSKVKSHE